MDFNTHFNQKRTTENLNSAIKYVGFNADRFKSLMNLFFSENAQLSSRAAHAVSHCVDQSPTLLLPYIPAIISHLENEPNVAVKRNIVRLLQFQHIPTESQGLLTTHCFNYLQDNKEAIAVKAFSMTILLNMCHHYPELVHELTLVIKDMIINGSSGIKNRGEKTLKQLDKLATTSTNH